MSKEKQTNGGNRQKILFLVLQGYTRSRLKGSNGTSIIYVYRINQKTMIELNSLPLITRGRGKSTITDVFFCSEMCGKQSTCRAGNICVAFLFDCYQAIRCML